MATITYTRPTGTELTVRDTPETRAYAEENKWVVRKPIAKRKTQPKTKE